ncbi:bifunctional adenosylcobinamide kinase/adenosylcobinamide-phosphate guanylyltransferase [Ramlibacter rhizophilus]|uniref:Adenosylcobinamide kinase n=1 Tax=Ramlibacter rhizophilus TaxID=1781167 RepID=A0A4Z0BYF7_9BURK|nr:bifunctional adenosylcobinamide kinase/adenosylcobinamide-phosphate guanylyltransferase [Ramlibacter rhizophilus]TFZ03340.1 adenosylcobinamide-phosphate guanylyltransferase [Ramlibacter rhizophilus]
MAELQVVRSELILGTGSGGRSARAQALAVAWMDAAPAHRAICIDTAQPWDDELRELIERCRRSGAGNDRLPRLEQPTELAHALGIHSRPDTLIVVDCLSFWLTASLMKAMSPDDSSPEAPPITRRTPVRLADAVQACAGPLVLVSNHIDIGGLAGQPDLGRIVDTLGALEQQAVAACERVTLMAGGLPLTIKSHA